MSQSWANILQEPSQEDAQARTSPVVEVVNAIRGLMTSGQARELISILRTPTPIKVSHVVVTDSHGCVGLGLDTPDPHTLYQCPMSAEGWIHRGYLYCPEYPPATALTAGELVLTGSTAGEIVACLPEAPDQPLIAPTQFIAEGRISAPHLNSGEKLEVVGDQLPPGIHLRFDFQIVLNTGVSQYTPRQTSPGDLDALPVTANIS